MSAPGHAGGTDWAALRARVDALGAAQHGAALTPEEARRVLEERARLLARPLEAEGAARDAVPRVTFALAGETYAVEAGCVVEVARLEHLTPIPGAEPPLFGVTAWRGDLLALYDLRSALGLPATALDDMQWIVVLGRGRAAFGILADRPGEMVEIAPAQVRPAGDAIPRSPLVLGLTPDAMVVLDGERLLALPAG